MKKIISIFSLLFVSFIAQAQTQNHHVDLTWTAATGGTVTSYNVYRALGNCASVATADFAKIGSAAVLAFSDTTVTQAPPAAGTSYCFAVTAVGPGGESAFSNLSQAVLLPFPPAPNPPSGLIAKPV